MNFKETILAMSAKEIIMTMVNALIPPPAIKINMSTYGMIENYTAPKKLLGIITKKAEGICIGCAATNFVCKVSGKLFTIDNIEYREDRAKFIDTDYDFLNHVEDCIDSLRSGLIETYNERAIRANIATIVLPEGLELPTLYSDYTIDQLEPYKQLAEAQP